MGQDLIVEQDSGEANGDSEGSGGRGGKERAGGYEGGDEGDESHR